MKTPTARVLVEFYVATLKRLHLFAEAAGLNRSQAIRGAVMGLLDRRDSEKLNRELASAYRANRALSLVEAR